MKVEIYETKDGSKTLLRPELNETYHSRNGAIHESEHVFIAAGLEYVLLLKKNIRVFEVGLGTGLNALLSLQTSQERSDSKIYYMGIEPYPLEYKTVAQLEYIEQLEAPHLQTSLQEIHESGWEEDISLSSQFTLHKCQCSLDTVQATSPFDLIYLDAFAPNVQPELWDKKAIAKLKALMNPEGVIVTYCAKGQFKRDLKELGFEVEGLPGPPGKREMTRATLKIK